MNTKDMIKVIESFEQTGKVLFKDKNDKKWSITDDPDWDFSYNIYKPYIEPIELYANIYIKDCDFINYDALTNAFHSDIETNIYTNLYQLS